MHFQTQALVCWKRKLGCKISMQAYQLARTQRPRITVMPSTVYQGLEWGLRFCVYRGSQVADAAGLMPLLGSKALDHTTRSGLHWLSGDLRSRSKHDLTNPWPLLMPFSFLSPSCPVFWFHCPIHHPHENSLSLSSCPTKPEWTPWVQKPTIYSKNWS